MWRCRPRTGHEAFSPWGRALYGKYSIKKTGRDPGPFVLPMPTVLIGATVNKVPNFMPVAFIGIVNFKPVVVACGLRPTPHTSSGISSHGHVGIKLPGVGVL